MRRGRRERLRMVTRIAVMRSTLSHARAAGLVTPSTPPASTQRGNLQANVISAELKSMSTSYKFVR